MNSAFTDKIESLLWDQRIKTLAPIFKQAVRALRFLYAVLRDTVSGNLPLRAMGLVYVTILSIVPVIAISFSLLKGFGFHRQLEPLLYKFLQPLGEKGAELTGQIIGFVDNVQGNVLAGAGTLLLFVTTISMAQKVEDSFNYVWRVDRPRGVAQRLSEYLSLIIVGPIVMVTAITLIAQVKSNQLVQDVSGLQGISQTLLLVDQLAPYAILILGFTMVYWFLPNTKVRFLPALLGGAAGGFLWATSGALFTTFVVTSTRTLSIYATFAIVIMALIWLYLCWLILLVGALVSFYAQNPEQLRLGYRRPSIGSRNREQIAISIMLMTASAFRDGSEQPTLSEMADVTGLPTLMLIPIINRMVAANILSRSSKDELFPHRDPGGIKLQEVIDAVREPQQSDIWTEGTWPEPVAQISRRINKAISQELGDQSVYDWLDEYNGQNNKNS